jgi:hypothetical protein
MNLIQCGGGVRTRCGPANGGHTNVKRKLRPLEKEPVALDLMRTLVRAAIGKSGLPGFERRSAYKDAKRVGDKYAKFRIYAVEGLAP